jgi:hypothetical protein
MANMVNRDDTVWLGKVEIEPNCPIIAGEVNTWKIIYTVGRYGIDNGGRLKLVWKFPSNWGVPQWENPKKENYITVKSTKKVNFSFQYDPKGYYRPWLKALTIEVINGYLSEGDMVTITLGDQLYGSPGSRAQTFYQNDFYFRLLVDCFESSKFKEIPNQPIIPVVSSRFERLKLIATSDVSPGEKINKITIKAEDKWGNIVQDYVDNVLLQFVPGIGNFKRSIAFSQSDKGVVELRDVQIDQEGIYRLIATENKLKSHVLSNPIRCLEKKNDTERLCWGDFHAQNKSTLGMGTDEEYFEYAKKVGSVDVSALQGNDFHLSPESWQKLKKSVNSLYKPGEFVTYLGYEWSGNTSAGGDHNVYYLDDSIPIHRSSHWQLEDKSDEINDRYPVEELYNELRDKKAMVIPHIGGRRAILDYLSKEDEQIVPVIEICSVHGRFEWFLHEAFQKNLIVGVVGNSDDHTCRPGASYPTSVSLNCKNGLTGFYCKDLTREGVWNAIKSRHCYATTGERIILEFSGNGRPMGSVFDIFEPLTMQVNVIGTSQIEKVEIVKDTQVLYSHPLFKRNNIKKNEIRILWGGARITSRGRHTNWDGKLEIRNTKLVNVQEVAFDNPKEGIKNWDDNGIEWSSNTSGDVDGLILKYKDSKNALFRFISKPISFKFTVDELENEGEIIKYCGGVNQHVKIDRIYERPDITQVRFEYTDHDIKKGLNRYYVRVTQENQEMAWSSPIYATLK